MRRILLFGRLRDGPPIGPVPATVSDVVSLKSWLATDRPELVADTVRIAVNDEMVVGNRPIDECDDVSLLPPVSGG